MYVTQPTAATHPNNYDDVTTDKPERRTAAASEVGGTRGEAAIEQLRRRAMANVEFQRAESRRPHRRRSQPQLEARL